MDIIFILKNLRKIIIYPDWRFKVLADMGVYEKMPDELYIRKLFKAIMGTQLSLENPHTFNEKIQWLKLYDRNPIYTQWVDKYKVKDYVGSIIGKEHIIPTIGVWDSPEAIDFDQLPDRFVLKCNHNSGLGMYICKDKNKMDQETVLRKLKEGLSENYYLYGREWPYKNVERKIIAEPYLEDMSGELRDYKLMCFNGKHRCTFVCEGRNSNEGLHVTFYDENWHIMPFERHYPRRMKEISCPMHYDRMREYAELLSKNCPFMRVDFYEVEGKLYFGEITLYPGSGFEEFNPYNWDCVLGDWLKLPDIKVVD